jgi:hypothetical protein
MARDLDEFSHAGIRRKLGYPDRRHEEPAPAGHRPSPGGTPTNPSMQMDPAGGISKSSPQMQRKPGPIYSNSPARPRGMRDGPVESREVGRKR